MSRASQGKKFGAGILPEVNNANDALIASSSSSSKPYIEPEMYPRNDHLYSDSRPNGPFPSNIPCNAYQLGNCPFGDQCHYLHIHRNTHPHPSAASHQPTPSSLSTLPPAHEPAFYRAPSTIEMSTGDDNRMPVVSSLPLSATSALAASSNAPASDFLSPPPSAISVTTDGFTINTILPTSSAPYIPSFFSSPSPSPYSVVPLSHTNAISVPGVPPGVPLGPMPSSWNPVATCYRCNARGTVGVRDGITLCWMCCPCTLCGRMGMAGLGIAVCAQGLCETCWNPVIGPKLR